MPSVIVNSSNIITFSFSDSIDIYNRLMLFSSAATTYESGGAANVLGISFQVKDKNGVIYTDFDFDDPDIIPADGSEWTFDWSAFGLPFVLGNTLIITGGIKDQDGTIYYTDAVYKKICKPNGLTESGYVPGTFQIIPNCIDNVLTVKELTILIYDKLTPDSVTKTGNLYYPTGTGITVPFTGTPFSNNNIITGQSRIECTTVATYDLGDDIFVLVTYLTKSQYNITCSNFLGDIACCLSQNQQVYLQNCGNAIGEAAKQKSYEVLPSLVLGLLKQISGEDASKEVAFIKKTMSCDCGVTSLGQNEMTPLNPAVTNIVLVGAGGTSIADPEVNGDTKTFTILSKNYLVSKFDSLDLAYSITTDTSVENQVNFKLKFNYNVQAGYILDAIAGDDALLTQLNSLITGTSNIDLSNLNGKCVIDISALNYFLSYRVPNAWAAIVNVIINGTTYNAPANLAVSDTAGIESWLNGLGLGTFSASFTTSTSGSFINILTNNNANVVTSAAINIGGNNNTVSFQKTSVSLIAVLQAIIDYICNLTALQVALGNSLTLFYFDYNGDVTSVNFTPTQTQDDYNVGLQNIINNIVLRIDELTGITCAKIKAIFPDSPLSIFSGSGRVYGIDQDGSCVAFTQQQIALAVMQAVGLYQNVKDVFCAIDCEAPATCPEVSNINAAIVSGNIGIYGVSFAAVTSAAQSLSVRYRVNGTTTWIVATNNLGVFANGNVSGTSPYLITGLVAGTTYDLWVSNNCGGAGYVKQITTPTTTIYSGSFLLDTVLYDICGDSPVTLYSTSPFASGVTMYSDVGLTTPVTGYDYIADNSGNIFQIDNSTGVVGTDTGSNCSSGTGGSYILGNDSGTICSNEAQTLYTNGVFTVGGTLYTDSALTTPVTGYSFVVEMGSSHIFNLNSSTGIIGADTGLACTVNYTLSSSYNFSIDSVSGTGIPTLPPTGLNNNVSGFQTGMSGVYNITLSGSVVTTTNIVALVNGAPVDCLPVTAAGVYALTIPATSSDIVVIAIASGACT